MGSQRKFQIPITKGTRLTKKHVFETHSVAIALYHLPYGAGDLRGGGEFIHDKLRSRPVRKEERAEFVIKCNVMLV